MFNDNGHLSNLKNYNMDSIRIYEKMTLSLSLKRWISIVWANELHCSHFLSPTHSQTQLEILCLLYQLTTCFANGSRSSCRGFEYHVHTTLSHLRAPSLVWGALSPLKVFSFLLRALPLGEFDGTPAPEMRYKKKVLFTTYFPWIFCHECYQIGWDHLWWEVPIPGINAGAISRSSKSPIWFNLKSENL